MRRILAVTTKLLPLVLLLVWQLGATQLANVSATIDATSLRPGQSTTLSVSVDVNTGLHAQSHQPLDPSLIPFELTLTANPAIIAGTPQYPPGDIETYAALGKVSVYTGQITVRVLITLSPTAPGGPLHLTGTVRFQACNDKACFPPQRLPFDVDLNVAGPPATLPATLPATQPAISTTIAPPKAPAHTVAAQTIFGFTLTNDAYLLAFGGAFLVGIIFNAMPCVLPVVPLKIMGFYEAAQHDRRKSVVLGTAFSAGVVFSFCVLALLIVVLHAIDWGGLFKLTWFTLAIVAVLLAMAAQTFGLFEVVLPTGIYSFAPRGETLTGNFGLGILIAALSTPCTFGVFATLLVWALAQPTWVGSSLLITVGVGMAFPYFVLSGFPEVARKFPRTGPVSLIIKQMMGFLLLATAIYFAQPLIRQFFSQDVFWWAMFAVVAGGAIFFFVRVTMVSWPRWPVVVAGIIAIGIVFPSLYVAHRLTTKSIQWQPYTPQALAAATASGRPVLIDFTATWCGNCHYIEAFVLHDPKVVRAVRNEDVLMLQADVTDDGAIGQPLLDKLDNSHAIPLTAVYPPHAAQPILLSGIYSVGDLVETLNRAH